MPPRHFRRKGQINARLCLLVFPLAFLFCAFLAHTHKSGELGSPIGKEAFYVVSLDGVRESNLNNVGRYEAYEQHARGVCGDHIKWIRQAGHVKAQRGAGLTTSFVEVIQHADANNVEFAYIFEDDVVMLNPLFCSSRFRHEMWLQVPQHFVLILAGHAVEASGPAIETSLFAFRNITKHYGSYAWCIKRENFGILLDLWNLQLRDNKGMLSPDVDLSRNFRELYHTSESYLLQFPQIFHHPAGYSNTWFKQRTDVLDKQRLSLIVKLSTSSKTWKYIEEYFTKDELIAELTLLIEPGLTTYLRESKKATTKVFVRRMSTDSDLNDEFNAAIFNSGEPILVFISSHELPSIADLFNIRERHFQSPYSILHYDQWPLKKIPQVYSARKWTEQIYVHGITVTSRVCAIQARRNMHHCEEFA